MSLALSLQFFALAMVFTLTPGADWAFAIQAGLRAPRIRPAILGMLSGYAFMVALVALGVGTLIANHPQASQLLTIFGAVYLLWLGSSSLVQVFRQSSGEPAAPLASETALFIQGFSISSLNPKGLLLLVALLPQFAIEDGWTLSIQMAVLGSLFIASCAIVYPGVGIMTRQIFARYPAAATIITVLSALIMIGLGVGLLVGLVSQ